jgi:hypothetical protein
MAQHDAKLQHHLANLRELVAEMDDLLEQSQAILAAQLSPDGISEQEAIDQLLGIFGGPHWREVDEKRKRLCKECRKGTSFHARLDRGQTAAESERQEAAARRRTSVAEAPKRRGRATGTGPLKEGTF